MKFLNLSHQYQLIKQEINEAIRRVLESNVFIGGKEVEELEKEIAEFSKTEYGVGVNSGTDALFLCLKALAIGPGDEVITTPFTFISPAEIIANLGAKPVFVDINPKTFNIDVSKIEEKITEKTKAIIPVHIFGQMAEMDEIIKIAEKHNLYIIEDAAQAIGAEYKNRKAGSIGDLGCFSFFPSKNLGAYGDAGMVVSSNKELVDRIRLLRNHGSSQKDKYLNLILGTNSRLDALQAAILRVKLKHVSEWNKKRTELAEYYNKRLRQVGHILTPFISANDVHVFNQYTIRTKFRDELIEFLKEKDIPTMVYYSLPLHVQPVFKDLAYQQGDFPEAEKAAKEVLSLPIFPELKKEEQDYIIQKIKEYEL